MPTPGSACNVATSCPSHDLLVLSSVEFYHCFPSRLGRITVFCDESLRNSLGLTLIKRKKKKKKFILLKNMWIVFSFVFYQKVQRGYNKNLQSLPSAPHFPDSLQRSHFQILAVSSNSSIILRMSVVLCGLIHHRLELTSLRPH